MNRVAWPGLMRLGMAGLGLPPAVFWDLTPAELFLLAGLEAPRGAMTRAGLADLLERYPDKAPPRAQPTE